MNLILQDNLSEATFAKALVLDSVVDASSETALSADVYWRWDEETSMEPQYLGTQSAGHTLTVPFDLVKDVRLFIVSRTASGRPSVKTVLEAEQTVVTASAVVGMAPSDLAIDSETKVVDDYQIDLSWTNHGGTGSVIIERRLAYSGPFSTVATLSASATSHTDTVLAGSAPCPVYYRVKNTSAPGYSNTVDTYWAG